MLAGDTDADPNTPPLRMIGRGSTGSGVASCGRPVSECDAASFFQRRTCAESAATDTQTIAAAVARGSTAVQRSIKDANMLRNRIGMSFASVVPD